MVNFEKVCVLVLDSAGVGAMPDAPRFGDAGTNTLGHIAEAVGGLALPNLAKLGLGHLLELPGTPPDPEARGAWARMAEASAGKDTITGHWEMAGLRIDEPFAVYPDGFPPEIVDPWVAATGRGVLGNRAASGTVILDELGVEHIETGRWILYTSADSVFQVAAHEEVVPLEELYAACQRARDLLDPFRVARVIARPFVGAPGSFRRTYNRRDFSMEPGGATLCDVLTEAHVPVVGVGKIGDIFAQRGVPRSVHTEGNADGLQKTLDEVRALDRGLVFTNLVDFDMLFGHRRNPEGYAQALLEADAAIPDLLAALGEGGLLLVTADHGCDPTYRAHTDHTREYVPVLGGSARFRSGVDLGTRSTFADLGQTVAAVFGLKLAHGTSFLDELAQL